MIDLIIREYTIEILATLFMLYVAAWLAWGEWK